MAKNAIRTIESPETPQTPQSPIERMAALVAHPDSKIDAAGMATLLDAQLKYEANEARKAYAVAMAAFKENPPKIIKDRTVGYNKVSYSHASLANVTSCINKALSEHGLSASWVTSQVNGSVNVACKITHILGHSEETSLSAAPDTSGSKNAIQAIGSTVTYLQRYTLLALTGLATYEDDDGKGSDERPPAVRPPTGEEWGFIDEVCKAITPPDGMCVDRKKVAALCYTATQLYPYHANAVPRVIQWLAEKDRPEIYVPKPKDEFDEHVEGYNAEHTRQHSQPEDPVAREAEATAAAKFGEENDQVPCRFLCNACSHEYDEFIKVDQCPKCLTKDVIDRQKGN